MGTQRHKQISDYILGSTLDDYENVETLQEQAKFHSWDDSILPSSEEIRGQLVNLIESGSIVAYTYSQKNNSFQQVEFSEAVADEYWFLAVPQQ